MEAGQIFLLAETAASVAMAGVIWTMQVLNYPLLALVGQEQFRGYEAAHNRRFGLVVFPGVLAAAAATCGLLAARPRGVPLWGPASARAISACCSRYASSAAASRSWRAAI
ncbi:MAG TPA: hypothetical protein VIY52_32595 [Streptosporangiaceae bacterium]